MTNYLEGYVRARQAMAEIERGQQVIRPAADRPDARAFERWLGGLAAMAKRTVSRRPAAAVRSRLSST